MDYKEKVFPVKVVEVAVCSAPKEGFIVVTDFMNRGGEVVSLSVAPDEALDLSDRLRRAYLEVTSYGN